MVDKRLLEILACPLCKADVVLKDEGVVCTSCGRIFPVKDDIPIMLVEEARLDEKEK